MPVSQKVVDELASDIMRSRNAHAKKQVITWAQAQKVAFGRILERSK